MNTPEIRYRLEWHDYTIWQRLRLWWRGVWDAITETPDRERAEWTALFPGQPGYDDAPFVCDVHYSETMKIEVPKP